MESCAAKQLRPYASKAGLNLFLCCAHLLLESDESGSCSKRESIFMTSNLIS